MANDALILLVIMLGCIGLAAIICWTVWGRARNFLNNELSSLRGATDRELADLSHKVEVLESRQQEDQATATALIDERGELEDQIKLLTHELEEATGQLATASSELVNQKLAAETAKAKLDKLQD
ncbi:MAG: hypothetical protein AB8B96_11020 [Lysobacterales bacterium]